MKHLAWKLAAAFGIAALLDRTRCMVGKHRGKVVSDVLIGGMRLRSHRCTRCRHLWETKELDVKTYRTSYTRKTRVPDRRAS